MNKFLKLCVGLGLIGFIGGTLFGGYWCFTKLKEYWMTEGANHYHQYCYTQGGYVINPEDKTVIVCNGVTLQPNVEEDKNDYKSHS